jgi:hypothetical protein
MACSDERRLKHRQDVVASSSGPSAKPKKLAKRPRLYCYQEESSLEASPPCGSTPDETECLKMYPHVIHTNQKIMNYSKEDPMNAMHLRFAALFPFWCLDDKGEKRVISISVFSSVVCNMDKDLLYVWLVIL